MEKKKEKTPAILFQKDTEKYEPKLKIESDLDLILKVFVSKPFLFLKKREGNKKVKQKKK